MQTPIPTLSMRIVPSSQHSSQNRQSKPTPKTMRQPSRASPICRWTASQVSRTLNSWTRPTSSLSFHRTWRDCSLRNKHHFASQMCWCSAMTMYSWRAWVDSWTFTGGRTTSTSPTAGGAMHTTLWGFLNGARWTTSWYFRLARTRRCVCRWRCGRWSRKAKFRKF